MRARNCLRGTTEKISAGPPGRSPVFRIGERGNHRRNSTDCIAAVFSGSARVSRVGFGVSPKQSFPAKIRAGETPAPTRETRALPETDFVGRLPTTEGWQPALPGFARTRLAA